MVKINEFHDMDIPQEIMPTPDYDVGQDLLVFMRNDPMFYRKHFFPTIDNVKSDPKNTKPLKGMIKKGMQSYCDRYEIKNPIEDLMKNMDVEEIISAIMNDELSG